MRVLLTVIALVPLVYHSFAASCKAAAGFIFSIALAIFTAQRMAKKQTFCRPEAES